MQPVPAHLAGNHSELGRKSKEEKDSGPAMLSIASLTQPDAHDGADDGHGHHARSSNETGDTRHEVSSTWTIYLRSVTAKDTSKALLLKRASKNIAWSQHRREGRHKPGTMLRVKNGGHFTSHARLN